MRILMAIAVFGLISSGALAAPSDGESYPLTGAFDAVPPQSEYYGHFLHGKVHHGRAVHGGGHLNAEALFPTVTATISFVKGRSFNVIVTPNLVNRSTAQAAASAAAVAHCTKVPGTDRVVFGRVERHSSLALASWAFHGACR